MDVRDGPRAAPARPAACSLARPAAGLANAPAFRPGRSLVRLLRLVGAPRETRDVLRGAGIAWRRLGRELVVLAAGRPRLHAEVGHAGHPDPPGTRETSGPRGAGRNRVAADTGVIVSVGTASLVERSLAGRFP
ncbi:hypothetical protein [Parafrankia sp. FMc2]|uniref:hypothetical protein n=1 Tax=Parafrankia sp. FMc2 TaxID=3233196 RepID=UPI0034D4FBCD